MCIVGQMVTFLQKPLEFPRKVKPQQERQCFKVQALSQLDAIAEEGLRTVNAELTTMAWARNQQI